MIICKKCGAECSDGNIFCETCGAELEIGVLPDNVDEKGRLKNQKNKASAGTVKKVKPPKAAAPKKERTPEEREKFRKKVKGAVVCIAVIAIILAIVWLISLSESNKGLRAAESIPIGRNVEYASSDSGLDFIEKCDNGLVNSMSDFDYICVSDRTVKVSGSEQPEWAVMLYLGDDGLISEVDYYDFSQLKYNWKGRKMAAMLDMDSLEFGMPIKNVNKQLGFKPYYISRNVNNEAVYCYRYYYYDEESGYDRAYNYYVEFSDVENTVKNVRYEEIDYAGVILSARNDESESVQAEDFKIDDELPEEEVPESDTAEDDEEF